MNCCVRYLCPLRGPRGVKLDLGAGDRIARDKEPEVDRVADILQRQPGVRACVQLAPCDGAFYDDAAALEALIEKGGARRLRLHVEAAAYGVDS